jgi:hypothetical protein
LSHIIVRDKRYPIDFDSLTVDELRFIKAETGLNTREFLASVNDIEVEALVAFGRVALRRSGKRVKSDYFDGVPLLQLLPQDDPEPADDPTGAASTSGDEKGASNPEKYSRRTSGLRCVTSCATTPNRSGLRGCSGSITDSARVI